MSDKNNYNTSKHWIPKLKPMEFKSYLLERLEYVLETKFDSELANGLSSEVFDSQLYSVLLKLKKHIYGESIREEVKIKMAYQIPNGFWQHFKQDYFTQFLLERFPVKYKIFTETRVLYFKRDFIFPKAYSPDIDQLSKYVIKDNHFDQYNFNELDKSDE